MPPVPEAEAAFIEWINSFDNISHKCRHISDLSNGIILFEVLADIDPKWFKLIRSADVGENWVLKINNLKKLHKLVSRYYEEVLGRSSAMLPSINLNAIAKDADVGETIKLCQLIICIAVVCNKNQVYISKIQSLPEQYQGALMLSIEQVMHSAGMAREPSASGQSHQMGYNDDPILHNSIELNRIMEEKTYLENQHKQLIEKHGQLQNRYDELQGEKEDLQLRLSEMDRAVEQASETGRADFIMRTEIEHLKEDIRRSEDRRQEVEMLLDSQNETIADLTRRGEELAKRAEQASRLKDQLDEYRHTAESLQRARNAIENLKKKLEDTSQIRLENKNLNEENRRLVNENMRIEEEYRSALAFKTLMDSYKEQVASLENKNQDLLREKNKMEYQLGQMTKKLELMEADHARDMDRIQVLEENLQDVQLGGTLEQALVQRSTVGDDAMDIDDVEFEETLEESLKDSNLSDLGRLPTRRAKTLQEETAGPGANQRAVVLQHLLEDANQRKIENEKKFLNASRERDILQSEMSRIRENIPDALLDQSQHTMSLRLRIIELEKEAKELRETRDTLEKKIADGNFGLGDDADEFRQRYKQMEERSRQLEEQTKQQLQDINKLLLEKDKLMGGNIEQKDLLLEKERLNR
ncbi:hypothetical protein K492DRAFT_17258 [Lichtheimia hyalospora FSU 10163]|nr:hypothetical protein K492DRAFT_17258 [Lichtheimia hyalospora FSU 10163]